MDTATERRDDAAIAAWPASEAESCLWSVSCRPKMAGDANGDLPSTLSALLREGGRGPTEGALELK